MRSNCNSESDWGGFTSTPITEKLPSSGSSLEPRLPETPVTTTTGFAISRVSQLEVARPRVAAFVQVAEFVKEAVRCRPGLEHCADSEFAAALPPPLLPDQSMLRWYPL